MKKIIYILVFVKTITCLSQNDGIGTNPVNFLAASEINGKIKLPKSPEADAFEKYGNTPVNLYTGTPDISIPIHTIKGRELEMPITLTYDASGIKVSQVATSAGLGWNLNLGGRISRVAVGIPDDIPGKSPYESDNYSAIQQVMDNGLNFNSESDLENYLEFMLNVVNGDFDTQLDYYSLNVLGINDYIVRDLGTDYYHTLMNPKITVELINDSNWVITNEDGTQYFFNNVLEVTQISQGTDVPGGGSVFHGSSTSSWLLTKVVSKNKMDTFDLEYKLYTWANGFGMPLTSINYTEKTSWSSPKQLGAGVPWYADLPYSTSQQMPYKIKYNNDVMVEFTYKSREDLSLIGTSYQGGNALNEILLYDFKTPILAPTYFKKVKLNHTYFGPQSATSYEFKRLKLNSLIFYETNITDGKIYSFDYDRPELIPKINSFNQDFLGLFNGKSNSNLVPGVMYNGYLRPSNASNRDFSFQHMTIGTLNKITYPTKGYTTFEYEQNNIIDTQSTIVQNIPGHFLCDETDFFNFNFRSGDACCFAQNSYSGFSQGMTSISPYSFYNIPNGGGTGIHNYSNSKSRLMNITFEADYNLEISGDGNPIFLIQRLPACDDTTNYTPLDCFETPYCFEDIEIPVTFNTCMKPINSLFITSTTNYSYPSDFVYGGICGQNNSFYDGSPINNTIHLQAGKYQVTAWNSVETNYDGNWINREIDLKISRCVPNTIWVPAHTVTTYSHESKPIEGFRVKKIKDFPLIGTSSTKEYKYIQDLESNFPSGIQLGLRPSPKISSTVTLAATSPSSLGCIDLPTLTASSESISTIPNVGYASVFVVEKNNNEQINGYTQTKFNVGVTGLLHSSGSPTSFEPIFENGKISEKKIYDSNKVVKTKEVFNYSAIDFYNASSFSYVKDPENKYASADGSSGWNLYFAEPQCSFNCVECAPGAAGPPDNLSDNDWYDQNLGKYSYSSTSQDIKGKFGYLSKKETFTYPPTGGELKQTEEYIYGNAESEYPYQLIEKITTGTNDIVKSEQYQYHPDYITNPEKITDIKYYNNGEQIFHKNIVYSDYGTANIGVANLVSEIKTAKGTNSLESRLLFDYDSTTKNILNTVIPFATTLSNDNYDSYIFGYNDMFPVAKLSGVKYSQISSQRLANIKSKSDVVISPSNELALRNELNLLRSDFPNAQITTYTYDPVIGVTSITDPKGYVQYFFYDELNRLKEVKDKNGNKLSENEYHYRP